MLPMSHKAETSPPTMTQERAVDLVSGNYGKETIRQIANYVAPIFWVKRAEDGSCEVNNGSIFFVDAGNGLFAVTAWHVFDKYQAAKESSSEISSCQIGPNTFGAPGREFVPFDLDTRLIDCDADADIATFQVLPEEMDAIGSTVLTAWPPMTPEKDLGIGFAGFPGRARQFVNPQTLEFGVYSALSVATEINDRLISCQIQHEYIVDVPGFPGIPGEFDTQGLSGGPLLTHVEKNGIYYWCLGGVIREASNKWEIIFASRADRLEADGTISPAAL